MGSSLESHDIPVRMGMLQQEQEDFAPHSTVLQRLPRAPCPK